MVSILNRPKFDHLKIFIALYKILNTGKYVNTVLSESKYLGMSHRIPPGEVNSRETSPPNSFKTNRWKYSRVEGETPPCTSQSSLGGEGIRILLWAFLSFSARRILCLWTAFHTLSQIACVTTTTTLHTCYSHFTPVRAKLLVYTCSFCFKAIWERIWVPKATYQLPFPWMEWFFPSPFFLYKQIHFQCLQYRGLPHIFLEWRTKSLPACWRCC